MRHIKTLFLYAILSCTTLFLASCATVKNPDYKPPQDAEERLKQAIETRKTLMRLLQTAKTVDDAVNTRDQLHKNQRLIEELEAGKDVKDDIDDGFKSTKERTVVYGPIGWVLVGSKWIIEKLYIVYPWNWRAF